jgi:hypothetical protein
MTDGELTQTPAPAPDGPVAWLELSARLGDIGRGVGQLVADTRESRALPVQTELRRGGDIPASGTLVIDFGGPAMGRRWTVRAISVSAASGVAGTLAGSANWYVGQPGAFGPGEWAAPTMTTLPAFQFVNADAMSVAGLDHLFCVITGGTAAQSALARARIFDYPQYSGNPTIEL